MSGPPAESPGTGRLSFRLCAWGHYLPGVLLVAGLAAVGLLVERWVPLFCAAVVAVALGVLLLLRAAGRVPPLYRPGAAAAGKQGLQTAVVLLGTGVGLQEMMGTGRSALFVLAATAGIGLLGIWWLGRGARLSWDQRCLLTVGTVVCGGTAIGALAPTIRARSDDIALAIAVVFGMNLVALIVFPPLGQVLGLEESAFGVWAGTAINDTSSVVAAGYSVGERAGDVATVVKLTRTTLIVPLVVGFGVWAQRLRSGAELTMGQALRSLPAFLLWFVVASTLQTLGVVDALRLGFLADAGRLLMLAALAGVGLGADIGAVRRAGFRPLAVGAGGWALVATVSLVAMAAISWW